MRKQLSPLMQEIAAHVLALLPQADIHENLHGDSIFVRAPSADFNMGPGSLSYDAVASWPGYVTHVPSAEETSWECRTLADIEATLRWPAVPPCVKRVRRVNG